ncbi:MAG: rhomboid family intramembrane serine protease [Bacteroidia bacterium]|nr:rhomboid family intramembrane serine protease [Bacteroidia bacterium]
MQPGISLILIGINVLLFLAARQQPEMVSRMLFVTGRIRHNREYDRLMLSGFLHISPMHLLFNMLTLYYFGPYAEQLYGLWRFCAIYLVSILGGNLFCLLMRREDDDYAALGASGGLLGLIYAMILAVPDSKIYMFFIPVGIPGWLFGILFTVISIALSQSRRGAEAGISHEGHLGGAAAGALLALWFLRHHPLGDESIWFLAGGLAPVILFAMVKWLAPGSLYRYKK